MTPSANRATCANPTGRSSLLRAPLQRLAGVGALAVGLGAFGLVGCAGMSPQARDASIGAAAGAVAGQVITGTTAGAAIGAAVGGVIGNENGKKK